ncbi:hypothetical protein [Elizabethkingia anophelis]|uniref:hypothetical protein n=1 Tax=Elizabethkingia anophelis TaxID=1117645 RepID=UPI002012AA6F|nr:hypothetical protein [Elizabethkingia anophelis]EJC8061041.1 hypothetical protein [Elizabethkingia anophelis]MCL1640986.1 hypothetical protein [Elizabethkingia anophelis]MCL1646787.1 hypothetical protein [Elizabethkingia anophelis]MDV3779783.1 hypothetical protein [Elizabethkingia anophelis]MDV3789659.1 hypothetical protein [Elizabethkingia anophelis]
MAALVRGNIEYFTGDEKEKKIYEYVNKLLLLFPDFDNFTFATLIMQSFEEKERNEIHSIISEVRHRLEKLGYIEFATGSNTHYILTPEGRFAKEKGGYFKYKKSLNPKIDWYKNISLVLTIITIIFTYLNFNLNNKKDKAVKENEFLKNQNDSLKSVIINFKKIQQKLPK